MKGRKTIIGCLIIVLAIFSGQAKSFADDDDDDDIRVTVTTQSVTDIQETSATGHGTIDSAAECIRSGAYSYLQKPCDLDRILEALKNAYKKKVMNKKKIQEKKIDELLKLSLSSSPLGILRKLKEIDKES